MADDHAIVREGLKRIVSSADDLVVVGEAKDGVGSCNACATSASTSSWWICRQFWVVCANQLDQFHAVSARHRGLDNTVLVRCISCC